jgi:hypothetical protein
MLTRWITGKHEGATKLFGTGAHADDPEAWRNALITWRSMQQTSSIVGDRQNDLIAGHSQFEPRARRSGHGERCWSTLPE